MQQTGNVTLAWCCVIYQATQNRKQLHFSFNILFFQERWGILKNEMKQFSTAHDLKKKPKTHKFTYVDFKLIKTDKLLILKIRNCKLSYWYREKHMCKGNVSLSLLDDLTNSMLQSSQRKSLLSLEGFMNICKHLGMAPTVFSLIHFLFLRDSTNILKREYFFPTVLPLHSHSFFHSGHLFI